MKSAPVEAHMIDVLDLNAPPAVEGVATVLREAAGTCAMDAAVLRECGKNGYAWDEVASELLRCAERLEQLAARKKTPLRTHC